MLDDRRFTARAGAAVVRLRQLILSVDAQLAEVDQAVEPEATQDPVVQALMTIRGIGPVLGWTIRAESGDIRRFAPAPEIAS